MLAEKLKGLRKKALLTQEDMAKVLKCSVATVCGYEKGKNVPFEVRMEYARYFNCSPEYLISDDIPFMDEPNLLEKPACLTKIPVLKNLAMLAVKGNVLKSINHPFHDNPPKRKAWLMEQKNGETVIAIIQETDTFIEGEKVVLVLDGQTTAWGYYYVDENRNVCIKSKPKGSKGIRNIRVGLKPKDKLIGIIDCIINK